MDLNSLTSKYLQNNKDVTFEDVKSAVDKLTISYGEAFYIDGVFSSLDDKDGLTEEEFIEVISQTTGKELDSIKKEALLLYQILNSDGDTSSLTNDELEIIMEDGHEINGYSVWNALSLSEKKVTKTTDKDEEESTSSTVQSEDTSTDPSVPPNVNGNVDTQQTQQETPTVQNYDFSDPNAAKAYVSQFINDEMKTPSEVIDFLEEKGLVSEEEAKLLRSAYVSYSDDIERMIQATMTKDGISREEAIAKLEEAGLITETEENSTIEEEVSEVTDDALLTSYAEQLNTAMKGADFWGTGEDKVEAILHNPDLSDEDLVKIIAIYNSKYGSFIQHVDGDFSGKKEDKQMQRIVEALANEAAKGNELAIGMLSAELYNATAGYSDATADSFLEFVFKKIDDGALKKVAEYYASTHDHDLTTAIDNDYNELDERGHNYVNQINRARSKK